MGIEPGLGFQGVLAGAVTVPEVIRSIQLEGPFGNRSADLTLDVLACGGTLPVNPGQLVDSPAMEAVLDHLKATYDLIVIDAPPVTAVSDAFSLLRRADGVAIVSWIGRSPRNLAESLLGVLESSGVSKLGVIANGAATGPRAGAYAAADLTPAPAAVAGENGSAAPVAPAVPTHER